MSLRVFLCIFLFVPVCVSLPEILRMFLIVSLHASRDVSLYVSLYVSSFVLFLFVKLQSCYARENHQKPSTTTYHDSSGLFGSRRIEQAVVPLAISGFK